MNRVPKGFLYTGLILLILAMIPPALIARQRAVTRDLPRIQLVQDMGIQHSFRAQAANPMFRDGRAMRPIIDGTVAQGELLEDDHFTRGIVSSTDGDDWATTFPERVPVNRALIERGQERYNIFCQVCHGKGGYGDGMVNERALLLQAGAINETTWVPSTNFHEQQFIDLPVGQIYSAITYGVRNMPAYGSMIPTEDRWAIVAYVRALQKSQNAQLEVLGPIETEEGAE